ncbi:hypothetical protein D3C81_1556780 [compost metagenome]
MISRSHANWWVRYLKPCPSSPRRLLTGTRTSSKNSSAVSCPLRPIFSRRRPLEKPLRSSSMQISVSSFAAGSSLVAVTINPALPPLVMKVFCPETM